MKSDEIDQKQLKTFQKDFLSLSHMRFSRMESSMSLMQADHLKLIPLIFHVNHPMLPGYVDKFTPCGIPNYSPNRSEKQIAKTISQSFEYKPRAQLSYKIASLFFMGSMGTLGQSNSSDIDLWVCTNEPLTPKLRTKLNEKAKGVKKWLADVGLELNYYIVNKDDFSKKRSKQLGDDNCGNTQNFLLLDEFYRTSIWIAGRRPLWWLIPEKENYDSYAKRLTTQKHINSADWIDFGEVKEIPASEYFSAALWQLYKSIESPYKSTVKLLVLEVYAKYFPCGGVLSNQLKKIIHQGNPNVEEFDPYFQILQFAEQALSDYPKRLEFLRRSFYLKSNIKVQALKKRKPSWRYQKIEALVKSWGWSPARLKYLNSRQNWDTHTVKEEQQDLIRELTNSYHFLSGFSRVQGAIDKVAKQDLLSLGRRLYSAFERRSGKIEQLNTGIVRDLFVPQITLLQKKDNWLLYLGHIERREHSLKRAVYNGSTLFDCICWGSINGIIQAETRLHVLELDKFSDLVLANEITKDLSKLTRYFDQLNIQKTFDRDAEVLGFGLFMNTESDPLRLDKENNLYHVAEQSDCFSWSESKINLAEQFEVVCINSWGEVTTQCFKGDAAWIDFFIQYNQTLDLGCPDFPIYCRRLAQKDEVVARVRGVLKEWKKLLQNSHRTGYLNRHIMSVRNKYLITDLYQSKANFEFQSNQSRLLTRLGTQALAEPSRIGSKVHLDPKLKLTPFLRNAIDKKTKNEIDFFLYNRPNGSIEVLVRSEHGGLHHQIHKNADQDQILGHYQQFFDKIKNRNLMKYGVQEQVHFFEYRIMRKSGKARFIKIELSDESNFRQFSLVQAIATVADGGRLRSDKLTDRLSIGFDLYTSDEALIYAEFGEKIYLELQKRLISMRRKRANYPIFLTDIDLSAILTQPTLIESLRYKKVIEGKLNKGL